MSNVSNRIDVLDKGYVILQDSMGSDLTPVNAARVSYNDKKETFDERDERLLKFLAREGHTSPFRHATLQFEFYAPLMVARQHWKYVVGSDHTMDGWNESSRRYVKEEPVFYEPRFNQWREAPSNSKQGSGDILEPNVGLMMSDLLNDHIMRSIRLYEQTLEEGVCAEQARLFLPAYGMYVRYYWTASLQSVAHFLNQRLEHDAQVEIQEYAKAVYELAKTKFPLSIDHLVGGNV